MMRFLLTIDELVALVRAKAVLAKDGQRECVDALNGILTQSALDVSTGTEMPYEDAVSRMFPVTDSERRRAMTRM